MLMFVVVSKFKSKKYILLVIMEHVSENVFIEFEVLHSPSPIKADKYKCMYTHM